MSGQKILQHNKMYHLLSIDKLYLYPYHLVYANNNQLLFVLHMQ